MLSSSSSTAFLRLVNIVPVSSLSIWPFSVAMYFSKYLLKLCWFRPDQSLKKHLLMDFTHVNFTGM